MFSDEVQVLTIRVWSMKRGYVWPLVIYSVCLQCGLASVFSTSGCLWEPLAGLLALGSLSCCRLLIFLLDIPFGQ
ncbi:hypothetical protein BC943DRAFT_312840 [Umbelopsis sp. AD052]|nr:hypothetical protein BC943DRAFT_312840 [Umbelopsis sp. AD052]